LNRFAGMGVFSFPALADEPRKPPPVGQENQEFLFLEKLVLTNRVSAEMSKSRLIHLVLKHLQITVDWSRRHSNQNVFRSCPVADALRGLVF